MDQPYWEYTPSLSNEGRFDGSLIRAMNWCQERGIRAELNEFGSALRLFSARETIWFEEFLNAEAKRDRVWWDQYFRNQKARFDEIRPDLTDPDPIPT